MAAKGKPIENRTNANKHCLLGTYIRLHSAHPHTYSCPFTHMQSRYSNNICMFIWISRKFALLCIWIMRSIGVRSNKAVHTHTVHIWLTRVSAKRCYVQPHIFEAKQWCSRDNSNNLVFRPNTSHVFGACFFIVWCVVIVVVVQILRICSIDPTLNHKRGAERQRASLRKE